MNLLSLNGGRDPLSEARELREQLSSDKRRLAFLLGAGTSMAVGLPGIKELTTKVQEALPEPQRVQYAGTIDSISGQPNVEDALNRIRLYRELLGDSSQKQFEGLTGEQARQLDIKVCRAIYDIVCLPLPHGMPPHVTFAQWLHAAHVNRDHPIEIFTTNYDLLLERAMERVGAPFFDGFVGAVEPFFVPESIDADERVRGSERASPPRAWARLWKLHGSVNWRMLEDTQRLEQHLANGRIVRLGDVAPTEGQQLIIFPSRDKYADSRRLPFVALQDRLRKILGEGELLLLILGYGFGDQHINEIIFQGLRSNPRLSVVATVYEACRDDQGIVLPESVLHFGLEHRNLAIYGPDAVCVGGVISGWSDCPAHAKGTWPFWSATDHRFTLGDFSAFAAFLEGFIGFGKSRQRGGIPDMAGDQA